MLFSKKILIFIICLNLFNCLINFDENLEDNYEKPRKKITSFEEFDKIMSNSEFSKAWENFKISEFNLGGINDNNYNFESSQEIPNSKINQNLYTEENKNNINNDNDNATCLLSKEETNEYLKQIGKYEENPSNEIRFIFGKCNPIILVPGMLSTKLQVSINCKGLYTNEIDIFKKIRFYCGTYICPKTDVTREERDLFISGIGAFQLIEWDDINKYSACTGYFLTFFNSKKACSPYNEKNDEYICNFSENIRIGYYGFTQGSKKNAKCGLEAMRNVLIVPKFLEPFLKIGYLRVYGPLIDDLEKKGYQAGFSLSGLPNDYRQFVSNNNFTYEAFRYQVEKLYENTGKPVVIISHSYGATAILNSLIYKKNKDILHKIKKFIAVAPPFAGSTQLINIYFKDEKKYPTIIPIGDKEIVAGFDMFGFGLVINKLPTAVELRPLPTIDDIFNKPGYEIFADAMKERLFLEKKCGHTQCDNYIINKYSKKFNALFKDYYPMLTDEECKFEKDLVDTNKVFDRKCLFEMHNMLNCPTIVEESIDEFGNLPNDFQKYCGGTTPNLFYQKRCDNSEKQCLDKLFTKHLLYQYEKSNEKMKYFINKWKESIYMKTFGDLNDEYFPDEIKYKSSPQKQIDFHEKISKTKDLPIPPIDTDIIYSKFNPTPASFIFDKDNFNKNYKVQYKGGDGSVPDWSPIISGLKWIYDTKKYNLKTKIRLIEFCSRLSKDSKYVYDPLNPDQKFAAISCQCLDENNTYTHTNCGHAVMIGDSVFFKYIESIVNDQKIKNELTDEKIKAYNRYNNSINYEQQCNSELLDILEKSFENSTSNE